MYFKNQIYILFQKILSACNRFPISVLFSVLATLAFILANRLSFPTLEQHQLFIRLGMTFGLGVPISLSAQALCEKVQIKTNKVKTVIFSLLFLLLLSFLIFMLKEITMVTVTRYAALFLAFTLAFTFIPFFFKAPKFELYVIRLFTSFFITYLYSMILFMGVSALLLTINLLFSINISSKAYLDIWLIVVGVFAPAFFLADIPKNHQYLTVNDYPKVISVLLRYILTPLIAAYTLILYIYFGNILLARELPQGVVANLVLWYLMLSTAVLLAISPLKKTSKWTSMFKSYLPKLSLPLLVMMLVSLYIRISAYGFTERRYFALVAGLWLVGIMLYHIFSSRKRGIVIPISLAVIAILSVIGPWSAYSTSISSQNTRFERLLTEHDMLKNGEIQPQKELSVEDRYELSSIIIYFNSNHDLSKLSYLPDGFSLLRDTKDVFGFELQRSRHDHFRQRREYFRIHLSEDELIDINQYQHFGHFTLNIHASSELKLGDFLVTANDKKSELYIYKNEDVIYSKDIGSIAKEIYNQHEGTEVLSLTKMTYSDKNQNTDIKLVFKNIYGFKDEENNSIKVESMEFYIFFSFR
ncbi:DUF4153 domain-containing protein [Proteinivorax hydrogeniformans]|uniref:DUF4153 domain-containing protein n=1 Tax=Proteinivorax hydrogeniformans TaxID=1826727 RepID=A0AAU8HVA2_9FIRM